MSLPLPHYKLGMDINESLFCLSGVLEIYLQAFISYGRSLHSCIVNIITVFELFIHRFIIVGLQPVTLPDLLIRLAYCIFGRWSSVDAMMPITLDSQISPYS